MDKQSFEKKLAALTPLEANEEDKKMLAIVKAESDKSTISHEQLRLDVEGSNCNGRISLRVPKSLHMELRERAQNEGVSLNQYILYKLAK